ncbi:MAG: PQQ-binding-like beta-propeller repeat protein [Pirellulales bacterium]
MGGITGDDTFVVVSSRDRDDKNDHFVCIDFETGLPLWTFEYPAPGHLDYGNSPRASALVADPYVVTLGAFGDLHCLDIDSGKVLWKKHLVRDLGGKLPIWGYAASPLVIEDKVIIQPGGDKNSMVALQIKDGSTVWTSPGRPVAYASPILMKTRNATQIVGFDELSLGGWDPTNGKRLWEHMPKVDSDFNVPTPVATENGLVLMSENNATRLHSFDDSQKLLNQPIATSEGLAADSHTPVRLGRFLIGVHTDLVVLDISEKLKEVGRFEDRAFGNYCSIIGCDDRVLTLGGDGECMLFQIGEGKPKLLGRFATQPQKAQVLSHPAMIGKTLLVRGPDSIDAWDLQEHPLPTSKE